MWMQNGIGRGELPFWRGEIVMVQCQTDVLEYLFNETRLCHGVSDRVISFVHGFGNADTKEILDISFIFQKEITTE